MVREFYNKFHWVINIQKKNISIFLSMYSIFFMLDSVFIFLMIFFNTAFFIILSFCHENILLITKLLNLCLSVTFIVKGSPFQGLCIKPLCPYELKYAKKESLDFSMPSLHLVHRQ